MVGKKILVALCVIALLAGSAIALVACAKTEIFVDINNLKVEMFDNYYVGMRTFDGSNDNNRFDLSSVFKDSSFALSNNTNCATLNNKTLTILAEGDFELEITNAENKTVKKIFVKDAYNVFDFSQLKSAIEVNKKSAIIHSELTFPKTSNAVNGNIGMPSNTSIFGNGNTFNVEAVVKPAKKKGWGGDAITVNGNNVNIQDVHVLGMDLRGLSDDEKKVFDISNLERFGTLIAYRSDDFNGNKVGGTLKNVVAENSHSVITITGATVLIEGCILRNAADSLVSVQTKNNGGTKLTMKNNVLINAVVAGVVCWGTEATSNFLDLTIEGFLDIYNWKDTKTTKIMPSSEAFSSIANDAVGKELSKEKFDKYMYKNGGNKFIHLGILVISTGDLERNKAKINGIVLVDEVDDNSAKDIPNGNGFVLRKFPVAGFENILKTACVIGYGNNSESKNISVTPRTKLDTRKIYKELQNGRK